MKLPFEKVLILLFIALVSAIIIPVIVFYYYNSAFKSTSFWIQHTQEVLRRSEEIATLSNKIILGSDEFLLTDDTTFLTSFKILRKKLKAELIPFTNLTKSNTVSVRSNDSIAHHIYRFLMTTDSINYAKQSGLNQQDLPDLVARRNRQHAKITVQINDIEGRARILLYRRNAKYQATLLEYNKLFVAYVVLVILLLASSFASIQTNLKKRKQAEEHQRISEEQLRSLVNSVKDYGIFKLDKNGTIVNWNVGAQNLFHYVEHEIIGKSFSILFSSNEIASGVPEKTLAAAIEHGQVEKENWRIRKDGTQFWANAYLIATYNLQGNLDGFTAVVQDFTNRKQLDEQKTIALEREKELNKMKSSFVALASHEFKSPLTTILLAASALRDFKGIISQEKYIDKILSNVKTLMTILDEFLSLEKIEDGKLTTSPDVFDVVEVTAKICDDLKSTDKQVIYKHDGEPVFCLDLMIYKQILTNLLTNALKYSPAGSAVYVSTSLENRELSLQVKDHGIGISDEDQKHLFSRFYRATNVEGIQGTGLGLHLVKGYVDMLNGTIDLQSALGKGTTVTVSLKDQAS